MITSIQFTEASNKFFLLWIFIYYVIFERPFFQSISQQRRFIFIYWLRLFSIILLVDWFSGKVILWTGSNLKIAIICDDGDAGKNWRAQLDEGLL